MSDRIQHLSIPCTPFYDTNPTKMLSISAKCDDCLNLSIAFITAIYGNYENSCKPYVPQTIPCDFICFTNNPHIQANGWEVDSFPYHEDAPPLDNGNYVNSIKNNKHLFNIAKYYKQSFLNINRLRKYNIVVWLDGTVKIIHPMTAEWIVRKINKKNSIITIEHPRLDGLEGEMKDSATMGRYTSTHHRGQDQPFQNVTKQYQDYLKDGYNDAHWKSLEPNRKHFGVWVTCFVAFDVRLEHIKKFLDMWYMETLNHTTQDQMSFSYVLQKTNISPYTLPDSEIYGDVSRNDLFIKLDHGC